MVEQVWGCSEVGAGVLFGEEESWRPTDGGEGGFFDGVSGVVFVDVLVGLGRRSGIVKGWTAASGARVTCRAPQSGWEVLGERGEQVRCGEGE